MFLNPVKFYQETIVVNFEFMYEGGHIYGIIKENCDCLGEHYFTILIGKENQKLKDISEDNCQYEYDADTFDEAKKKVIEVASNRS